MPEQKKSTATNKDRKTKSGTVIYSGQITTDEYNTDLTGDQALTTYDKMIRSNGTVSETLDLITLPIRSAKWFMESASEDDKDVEVADFVEAALFENMNVTWDAFLEAGLEMLPFGFSPFEIVEKEIMWNGQEHFGIDLYHIAQKTIYAWQMANGDPGIQQKTYDGHTADLEAENLLLFTFRQRGENYEGRSVLRAAYPHWYYVNNFYKIESIGVERSNVGIPIVKAPQGADPDQIDKAKVIAKNIRANEQAGIALPNGFTLEMMDMKSQGTKDALPLIQHHILQIAHATLTAFAHGGSTPNGSRATSVDLSSMFLHSMEAVARQMADIINKKIVRRLVNYNFPDIAEYPKLNFSGIKRTDVEQVAKTTQQLMQSGGITPDPRLENHLRKLQGFPEKEIEEKPVDSMRPAEMETEEDQEQKKKSSERPVETEKKVAAEIVAPISNSRWARPLTASEEKVDFEQLEKRIERGELELSERLFRLSEQQQQLIVEQLRIALESDTPAKALQGLNVAFQDQYGEALFEETQKLFEFAKVRTADEMGDLDAPATTEDAAGKLELNAQNIAKKHGDEIVFAASTAATNALLSDRTTDEALALATDAMKEKAQKQIDATAQANVIGSINQGRTFTQETYRDRIYAYQYSAILDLRTCNTCLALDQKVVETDDKDFKQLTPPQHFNCRCIWVEILEEEEEKPPITGIPAEIDRDLSVGNFKQVSQSQVNRLANDDSINEAQGDEE